MGLDFNFSLELVVHLGLPDLVFEQHLQGHNKQRTFLPGQIHLAEFSLSQATADVKILQFPLFPATNSILC